jgi:glycosyltransferase involved in cell wall biosynthesis
VALLVFGIKARRVGGIEIHTREVVQLLAERGWEAVLCFHEPPDPAVREYLALPNVRFDIFPDGWSNSRGALAALTRLLRRYRPALLHLQFTPFLGLQGWNAKLHGVRTIVFTDHGSHPEGYQARRQPLWKRVAGRILTHPYSLIVAVSEYNQASIAVLGTSDPKRIRRVYNGADLTRKPATTDMRPAFRARHGIPADRILVTQVSWIRPDKGVPDVIEAAAIALGRDARLHFAFAGDGAHQAEYARRCEELGIAGHITWLGLVKDPMLDGVFAATDISCQASRWQEAFGLVIAEAMAFGNPVVGTRVGGIAEVIEDGVTGYLVERRDPSALAARILELARDPELRERMGHAGRLRAEQVFDVRRNAAELVDLYSLG